MNYLKTDKKECPECRGRDLKRVGYSNGSVVKYGAWPKDETRVKYVLYTCKNCQEDFLSKTKECLVDKK